MQDGGARGAGRAHNWGHLFHPGGRSHPGVAGEGLENMGCDGKEWALKT